MLLDVAVVPAAAARLLNWRSCLPDCWAS